MEGGYMRATTVDFGDKTYSLDKYGFLDPPGQWDEGFARGMARMEAIYDGLTEEHWTIIRYLRVKFLEENTVPMVVFACADNKIRMSKLKRLFPTGYHRGACRIAGINYDFMYETNIWLTYENYEVLKSEHKLTDAGFLEDFDRWNQHFAQTVAREWNLRNGLTHRHWAIIEYLRNYYRIHHNIPTVYETCRANRIQLNRLLKFFPDGYRRGACRAAGLPFFA
jgi:tRNA 2-thiouridine synthesizing protein E